MVVWQPHRCPMKMSPFAFVAMVMISAPAFAQSDACHDRYAQCVDRCSGRPQNLQESCSSSCEATANQSDSQMYGGQQSGQQMALPPEAEEARDEAPAKDDAPTKKAAVKGKKPL